MTSTGNYHMAATLTQFKKPTLKRSHTDMREDGNAKRWIDQDHYQRHILRLPVNKTEDQIDQDLHRQADKLGVKPLQVATNIESITSSLSATTISSDPTNQSSAASHSTAPTSCSSSEHRPPTSSTHRSEIRQPISTGPSILSEIEKKRSGSSFRNGIRRMAGLSRKRKPANVTSNSTSTSQSSASFSNLRDSPTPSQPMFDFGGTTVGLVQSPSLKRSPSTKSNKSLWSNRLSAATVPTFETQEVLVNHKALQRSMECKEIVALRTRQLEERQRFLEYRSRMLSDITAQRNQEKIVKAEHHETVIAEQMRKDEKAVEDLEFRQLEEELKIRQEQEREKRSILSRLRHMENYCQTPSPPQSPVQTSFSQFPTGSARSSSTLSLNRKSFDSTYQSQVIPERKVTEKDYYNLASSYRERDTMDNLHTAKINVLRGRQKRAVEALVARRERLLEKIEFEQSQELAAVDAKFLKQETACQQEFREKQRLLERRWKLQALIERAKQEILTGLKYEQLPDVVIVMDENVLEFSAA